MRILTFNYEYPPLGGGGGVAHKLIARALAKRHHVAVITSAFGDLPQREHLGGVEIIRVPVMGRHDLAVASLISMLSYPGAAVRAARRLHREERFDIVNGHFAVPTGVGSIRFAREAGLPHVISVHGGDLFDPSKALSPHRIPGLRAVVRSVMRRSDAVVAQSNNTRENAIRYYGHKGPIEVIPLGVDVPAFPPRSRAELGLPQHEFVAITVGRLIPRKRVDELLRAVARPECNAVRLIVVGEGPDRPALDALARELGIEQRVDFAGHVSEERKWQLLAASDVYVSATEHEGFGLVFIEAMIAGLPIVTCDHGGQAEFLRDGVNGFLVPVDDTARIAAAINELRSNPARAESFRENNLAAAQRYHVARCADDYERLFLRLVSSA